MLTVYLAGGMHTEWRERVKKQVPFAIFLDPTSHGLRDESAYTQWDLAAIEKSEIVFAYLEKENPSGLGMMFELGYAAKAAKTIILVNEWEDSAEDTYVGMARATASVYYTSLEAGINFLLGSCIDTLFDLRIEQEQNESYIKEELLNYLKGYE